MTCTTTEEASDEDVVARFEATTLPPEHWTHEAHLEVCRAAIDRHGMPDALDHLRLAIRRYNDAVGTPNTDTSGYHETLTRYYVAAVHAAQVGGEQLAAHPWCRRDAPLTCWSTEVLRSTRARRSWVEPDRAPLPWAG